MGECPEWQRELTVNQPSYDFEGSSPSSPTSLRLLRKLRLGKPHRSEGCRVVARRAKTGLAQRRQWATVCYSVSGIAAPGRNSLIGRISYTADGLTRRNSRAASSAASSLALSMT